MSINKKIENYHYSVKAFKQNFISTKYGIFFSSFSFTKFRLLEAKIATINKDRVALKFLNKYVSVIEYFSVY